jgi:hypothetical protein
LYPWDWKTTVKGAGNDKGAYRSVSTAIDLPSLFFGRMPSFGAHSSHLALSSFVCGSSGSGLYFVDILSDGTNIVDAERCAVVFAVFLR